jgi:hypothetical protein
MIRNPSEKNRTNQNGDGNDGGKKIIQHRQLS